MYVPREAHQPRGGRPWCSTCHTDRYLLADSVTVLDSRTETLALAVTGTRCEGSRVLATTATFAADIMGRAGRPPKNMDAMTNHIGPNVPALAKENK